MSKKKTIKKDDFCYYCKNYYLENGDFDMSDCKKCYHCMMGDNFVGLNVEATFCCADTKGMRI